MGEYLQIQGANLLATHFGAYSTTTIYSHVLCAEVFVRPCFLEPVGPQNVKISQNWWGIIKF